MLRQLQLSPLAGTLGLALLLLVAYWVVGFLVQRSIVFPGAVARSAGMARPDDAHVASLVTTDGEIEAWYLPPTTPTPAGPLLIFAHGNGELIDFWPGEFGGPRSWGIGVLLVEYPGYGRSDGKPSEDSIRRAMIAAWEWATGERGFDAELIVAYGRSLGAGAACALAAERTVGAIVLESGFTSVEALAWRMGMPSFLVRDPFDNGSVLARFEGPVLLVHGEHDQVIPADHSRRLHEVAPRSELRILSCGHNDCPRPWEILRRFLVEHDLLAGPADGT